MEFLRVLLLVIGVLSLFSNIAECVDDIDDRGSNGNRKIGTSDNNVSSIFLGQNFNQETNRDQRYWYEYLDDAGRMLKSKTDILSRLFKMQIERLRNKTDQVKM